MDNKLRELERAALSGDFDAAYRFYIHQLRSGVVRSRLSGPGQSYQEAVVDFEARNFNGPLKFTVSSETHIIVSVMQEPDEYGGLRRVPVYINGVPYRIYKNLYYYSDAEPWNWIFNDPESVQWARQEFQQSSTPHWRSWQDALDSDVSGSITRVPNNDPPTQSALRLVNEILPRVVSSWANQNPELLRKAGLADTNNNRIDLEGELQHIEQQAQELRDQIGRLVIDELRLQD